MSLFVYVADDCRKEAAQHALSEPLERFRDRVEKAQDTRYFDAFPPPYLVKKKLGGQQGRLIAERHTVKHGEEDHTVIVFVSVLIRGEHAYDSQFGRDPEKYGQRFFKGRFEKRDLQEHVADRLKKEPVKEKPAPSSEEYNYLYQVLGQHGPQGDEVVVESADWVALMQQPPFLNWHAAIYQGLQGKGGDEKGGSVWDIPGKPGWGLLIRRFSQSEILFLVAPIEERSGPKATELRTRYAELLEGDTVSQQKILRRSRRAYPEIVLADGDLWLELQIRYQSKNGAGKLLATGTSIPMCPNRDCFDPPRSHSLFR